MKTKQQSQKRSDVWSDFSSGPGRHHESYENSECLLPELGIVGWLRFFNAFEGALEADSHPGEFEIHYIVNGELSWWVEDRTYDLRSGMVLIIAPGELHGSSTGVLEPCEHYWLRIRFPESKSLPGLTAAETKSLRKDFNSFQHRVFLASEVVRDSFAKIIDEHRNSKAYSRLACRCALHLLLTSISREYETRHQSAEKINRIPAGIQRSMRVIHEQLEEPPAISELAEVAGQSESAFRKQFKETVGCSPHDYLTRRRIQAARQMLARNDMSITEIAHQLGFSSSQYFATVFKRVTGQNPRDFSIAE